VPVPAERSPTASPAIRPGHDITSSTAVKDNAISGINAGRLLWPSPRCAATKAAGCGFSSRRDNDVSPASKAGRKAGAGGSRTGKGGRHAGWGRRTQGRRRPGSMACAVGAAPAMRSKRS